MASATFLPGIVVSMIIVTGYVYPRLFCLGIKSASGRPIPPDPRESATAQPPVQQSLTDRISAFNATMQPTDYVELFLLSSNKDRIICPTTESGLSSSTIHFMCETGGQAESMHYELSSVELSPIFNGDSVRTCSVEKEKIMGVDFHIRETVISNQPRRVGMLMYHQSSNLSTAAGETLVVKCAARSIGSNITKYSDEINFRFLGLPGVPIDQRLLNESLNNDKEQCHNISLWTPGSNSEIKYFEVRLENSNNVTVVPATQWNASLTLCSHEKQTHYKIVAVDKCGQHSDPIPVELKWDIDKESANNVTPKPMLDNICEWCTSQIIEVVSISISTFVLGIITGLVSRYVYYRLKQHQSKHVKEQSSCHYCMPPCM